MKEKGLIKKQELVQKLDIQFDEVSELLSEETLESMAMMRTVGGGINLIGCKTGCKDKCDGCKDKCDGKCENKTLVCDKANCPTSNQEGECTGNQNGTICLPTDSIGTKIVGIC